MMRIVLLLVLGVGWDEGLQVGVFSETGVVVLPRGGVDLSGVDGLRWGGVMAKTDGVDLCGGVIWESGGADGLRGGEGDIWVNGGADGLHGGVKLKGGADGAKGDDDNISKRLLVGIMVD